MNGRVYDPTLGRFLSADPIVQSQFNPQSLNRYSYVLNNPLSYTDPSGLLLKKLWKKAKKVFKAVTIPTSREIKKYWRPIVAAVAAYYTWGASLSWTGSYVIAGAASGAVAGGITTGTWEGATKGAISGAIFGGIQGYYGDTWTWSRVAVTSVSGGVTSEISGGKFEDGFLSALTVSMVRMGWGYTKEITNDYKLMACRAGKNECEYNKWGELLTDGTRGAEYKKPYGPDDNNWFTESEMGPEGRGTHRYKVDSMYGRFINKVSKVHDWSNSDLSRVFGFHGYSRTSGLWIGASEQYNTLFQAYSLIGMVPAGAYTAVAMSATLPVDSIYRLSRSR